MLANQLASVDQQPKENLTWFDGHTFNVKQDDVDSYKHPMVASQKHRHRHHATFGLLQLHFSEHSHDLHCTICWQGPPRGLYANGEETVSHVGCTAPIAAQQGCIRTTLTVCLHMV
jgi:hypothetical protein